MGTLKITKDFHLRESKGGVILVLNNLSSASKINKDLVHCSLPHFLCVFVVETGCHVVTWADLIVPSRQLVITSNS